MTERKNWSEKEDNALRYLRQELKITKWSIIAEKLNQQFQITPRTGKQCRQRYHNHLDKSIIKTEWQPGQQQLLYKLHDQLGNRWAKIAENLPGRTDNCVKNHYYSKLRKSLRQINKIIHDYFKKQLKQVKSTTLFKIIELNDQKNKSNTMIDEDIIAKSMKLKNQLLNFANYYNNEQNPEYVRNLVVELNDFSKLYKKGGAKKQRKSSEGLLSVEVERPRASSWKSQEPPVSTFDESEYDDDLSLSLFSKSSSCSRSCSQDFSSYKEEQQPQKMQMQESYKQEILKQSGLVIKQNQMPTSPPISPPFGRSNSRGSMQEQFKRYFTEDSNYLDNCLDYQIKLFPPNPIYSQPFGEQQQQ